MPTTAPALINVFIEFAPSVRVPFSHSALRDAEIERIETRTGHGIRQTDDNPAPCPRIAEMVRGRADSRPPLIAAFLACAGRIR